MIATAEVVPVPFLIPCSFPAVGAKSKAS